MTWTKATYLSRTREWMDATGSDRWSDAFLYALLGLKHREEWEGILDANPTYRFAQRSLNTDANGQFQLSDLSSGSGDTVQTAYKLIAVTDGNTIQWRETEFARVPLGTSGTMAALDFDRSYYLIGDSVQLLPSAGGQGLVVSCSLVPVAIDQLSGDSSTVDFVDGYENLIALCAAADALAKGGTETGATADLRALAQTYRQGLYASVARRTTTPTFLGFSDSSYTWGG